MSKKIQGTGDSKIFAAPQEACEPPAANSNVPPRETWTVGGVSIVGTPFEHVIAFENTDQGVQQRLAREHARAEIIADTWDKTIQARSDLEPWEAPDPMAELTTKYTQPGQRAKFLSPRVVSKRGLRGFEVVKSETGDPVKMANMILGVMPEERARKRDQHYRDMANQALKASVEDTYQQQERLIRDSQGALRGLRPGETLRDIRNPGRMSTIGLHSQRGNESNIEVNQDHA